MRRLLAQAAQFVGISGLGWLVDVALFALLGRRSGRVMLNNMASSLAAVALVFAVSTRRTFVRREGGLPLRAKFVLYAAYQLALLLAVSRLVAALAAGVAAAAVRVPPPAGLALARYGPLLAKVAVTPLTMAANFCVMKVLVERL